MKKLWKNFKSKLIKGGEKPLPFQSESQKDLEKQEAAHRQLSGRLKFLFLFLILALVGALCFINVRQKPEFENKLAIEEIHKDLELEPEPESEKPKIPDLLASLENQCRRGQIQFNDFKIAQKEGLLDLLKRAKVPSEKRQEIIDSYASFEEVNKIKSGEKFYIFSDEAGKFLGLVSYKDDQTRAVVEQPEGGCVSVSHSLPLETATHRIQGKVEKNFSISSQNAGLPKPLVREVISALDGEIDFYSDLRKGDSFDIIYERLKTPSGLEIGDRKVVFIGLKMHSDELNKYAYTNRQGITSFYTAKGHSGEKVIYKRPIKGRARLTSNYGNRRHPFLLYTVFHHGVDLAAPMNTPIIAAADGVVVEVGRKGGYGKYIRLRHADGYQTAYGHLNGYRKNLRVGTSVKQGDTIGYLGTTGRSTGPHLHFEVIKNGTTHHPFNKHVIQGQQLKGFELEQFQSFAESLHPDYLKHLIGKIPKVPQKRPEIKEFKEISEATQKLDPVKSPVKTVSKKVSSVKKKVKQKSKTVKKN